MRRPDRGGEGESMRRPRFVTFDAFGTLFRLDEVASRDVMEDIISATGLSMTADELGKIWWDKSYQAATQDRFVTVEEATMEALSLLFKDVGIQADADAYTQRLLQLWTGTGAYPEVPEALRSLEGFTLGIVSNIDNDLLEALLASSGLAESFTVRVTSEDARAYKPDHRIFETALGKAGCHPEEALHIGDSPVDDVLGPKRVGMMAGWVNRRGDELRGGIPRPDFTVRDLQEAARLIRATRRLL